MVQKFLMFLLSCMVISNFAYPKSINEKNSENYVDDDCDDDDDEDDEDENGNDAEENKNDEWKNQLPKTQGKCDAKNVCDLSKCPCVKEYIKLLQKAAPLTSEVNIFRPGVAKTRPDFYEKNPNYENIEIKPLEKLTKTEDKDASKMPSRMISLQSRITKNTEQVPQQKKTKKKPITSYDWKNQVLKNKKENFANNYEGLQKELKQYQQELKKKMDDLN